MAITASAKSCRLAPLASSVFFEAIEAPTVDTAAKTKNMLLQLKLRTSTKGTIIPLTPTLTCLIWRFVVCCSEDFRRDGGSWVSPPGNFLFLIYSFRDKCATFLELVWCGSFRHYPCYSIPFQCYSSKATPSSLPPLLPPTDPYKLWYLYPPCLRRQL